MGKWLYTALFQSYLMYLPPEGLLGAGWWPGAAQKDFNQYWHPRFCIVVPEELVAVLFPFLSSLEEVCPSIAALRSNVLQKSSCLCHCDNPADLYYRQNLDELTCLLSLRRACLYTSREKDWALHADCERPGRCS